MLLRMIEEKIKLSRDRFRCVFKTSKTKAHLAAYFGKNLGFKKM